MHAYHNPDVSRERVASKLRDARRHELVHLARAAQSPDQPARGSALRRILRLPLPRLGESAQPVQRACTDC